VTYYVAYQWSNSTARLNGFGGYFLTMFGPLNRDLMEKMRQQIERQYKGRGQHSVVILNVIRMEGE